VKLKNIIVNEYCWNALAKHADIVLPCTMPLERSDIALTPEDPDQMVMDQAIKPVGQARDDHEILRGIATIMGVEEVFTVCRSPEEWQRWIWDISSQQAAEQGVELPDWESLQRDGWINIPAPEKPTIMMQAFRDNPGANPLATPSGKIEIYPETIANFGHEDCPCHPTRMEPATINPADAARRGLEEA
jgi:biotin/methionine sulfoxide reductase